MFPSVAIIHLLFSLVALLFVEVVLTTACFRLALLCIEHLKFPMRSWLFYTNQPYLWLLGWLSHILYVPPPEPHVMMASRWHLDVFALILRIPLSTDLMNLLFLLWFDSSP